MVSRRLNFALPVTILLLVSCCFGLWFKYSQLSIVGPQLIPVYPVSYWLYPCFITFLVFCIFWLFTVSIYKIIFVDCDLDMLLRLDAMSYLIFIVTVLNIPIKVCFLLFLASKVFLFFLFTRKFKLKLITLFVYQALLALFFYGIALTIFMGFISPVSWGNPVAACGEGESGTAAVGSALHRISYVNAKLFDFSGFDYSYWGAISHSVRALYSVPFSVMAWVLDLPSIDVTSFYCLLGGVYFFGCIFSCFGFFLFVRYGLRLSYFAALWGGLLFLLANSFFIEGFALHFPIHSGGFLILPYVFLLLRLAFRRDNFNYALFSGFVFSLQFYIPGHPDTFIHSFMMITAYLLFHTLFNSEVKPLRRFYIFLLFGAGLIVGSASYLGPIIEAMAQKEFNCWGHAVRYSDYPSCAAFFTMHAAFIALGFIFIKYIFRNREQRVDYIFFLTGCIIFLLFFLPHQDGVFSFFMSRYLKIHYSTEYYRIFMYLAFSGLVIAVFGLHYLLENRKLKYAGLLVLFFIGGAAIFYWRYGTAGDKEHPFLLVANVLFLIIITAFCVASETRYKKYMQLAILLATIGILFTSDDIRQLRSGIFDQNPHGNKPYITIQAILDNYQGLKADPANLKYIKNRLLLFERDIALMKNHYARDYYQILKNQGVSSAAQADMPTVLRAASCAYPIIDAYYLDDDSKLYPPVFPVDSHDSLSITIPDYNNVSILENIGSRHQRVLAATRTDSFFGVGEGFFVHNGTSTLDSRFMSGNRALNALYLIPDTYHERSGGEDGPIAWYFNADIMRDKLTRKLFNIAGVNIYVFNEKEFGALPLADKEDLKVINYSMHPRVKPPFAVVKDQRSYAMAYLAEKITVIDSHFTDLDDFSPPFSEADPAIFNAYKKEVDKCRSLLSQLRDRHDIFLELDDKDLRPKDIFDGSLRAADNMDIVNILGNKAVFNVDCAHGPCVLVMNYAAIHGWRAFCDQQPVKIRRANFAFMAVQVPHGKHLVWFEHRRASVIWGSIITLLGYLGCGIIFLRRDLL